MLYLVKRDGIPLLRVEVGRIADAYLEWIERTRALDLSLAADWLLMAATLLHLKSLELLPRPPVLLDEEEQDPRDALIEQLQEYERIKAAADVLETFPRVGREVHVRPPREAPTGPAPLAPGDVFALLDLFHEVLARGGPPEVTFQADDSGPDFGICCRRVLALLGGKGGRVDLGTLLLSLRTAAERVVTFVGVLEMVRLGWLDIEQERHLAPVSVMQVVEDQALDLHLLTGWVEEEASAGEQMPLPLGGRRA